MSKVKVTKEITFEMAHALSGYSGKYRNIHGHTYHLSVCVLRSVVAKGSTVGMVLDFQA